MPLAPLRPIEAIQIMHEGEPMVLLRDPEGLCPEPVVVSLPVFLIATLFDGQREAADVQQLLMQASGGQVVPVDEIQKIAEELDGYMLFENAQAQERRALMAAEWDRLPARPAVHAGGAYPDTAPELTEFFTAAFEGLTPPADRIGARPRGLIVPHIDLRIGARTLAEGLARVHPHTPPRLYIILGVAHAPTQNFFTLTDKDFESPLGAILTDKEAAAHLSTAFGAERLAGGIAHLQEHSVEFPAVALRHYHREMPEFKILPILCGPLHEELQEEEKPAAVSALILPGHLKTSSSKRSPGDREDIRAFIGALRQLIADYDHDVCIVASVDLSHVGRKFGDERGIDLGRKDTVRRADEAMLGEIERLDAEAFFDTFRADKNARNVDAITSVYVLLKVLEGHATRAERISYEQWHEEPTDSMVTYASMAIY